MHTSCHYDEQLMVYVQFIDATDEPRTSIAAGELQLSITAMAINNKAMDVSHMHVEDAPDPTQNTRPYLLLAIVDHNERINRQSDELDSGTTTVNRHHMMMVKVKEVVQPKGGGVSNKWYSNIQKNF